MSDPRVEAGERAHEGAIFAGRHGRNTTDPTKRSACYRQACASRLGVARQGVGRIRVEPIRYAVEQLKQPAFQRIIGVQMSRDERRLRRRKYGPPAYQVGAPCDRFAIALDPVRRRHGVSIRGYKNAIGSHQPFGTRHGQPPRVPRIRVLGGKVTRFHMQLVGQCWCHG
jgi:hypothetical protein